MDSGEPCGGQAGPGCLPSVTHGVAEGRALAQSRRRYWARTPHKDSLRGHAGHAGQMLDSTQGDISLPSGHPPWHCMMLEGWPPTRPVKERLCVPPRHGRTHGRAKLAIYADAEQSAGQTDKSPVFSWRRGGPVASPHGRPGPPGPGAGAQVFVVPQPTGGPGQGHSETVP